MRYLVLVIFLSGCTVSGVATYAPDGREGYAINCGGKLHNWRADLVNRMSELQRKDGSWTNPADRWYEGDPNLVTAYALLALSYCDQSQTDNSNK